MTEAERPRLGESAAVSANSVERSKAVNAGAVVAMEAALGALAVVALVARRRAS